MLDDPELLDEFVAEARDHLARIETILSGTSRESPDFVESINAVFRGMHSIKGAAAMLGLPNIREVSNAVETVLAAVREGECGLGPSGVEVLLRARDRLWEMVDDLENEGTVDAREELAALSRLLGASGSPSPLTGREATAAAGVVNAEPTAQTRAESSPAESIRVPLSVLDHLMVLVGELVLVRNRTQQNFEKKVLRDRGLATGVDRRLMQQLDLVTTGIQTTVLQTRMQPIRKVFEKVPRVCRDLAGKLEKRIQPISLGDDVRVDKAILECLSAPLLHLIRNACDHGLESPAERAAAGKSPVGTLTVEARLDAAQISILITDDGRGIDTKRVAKEAVAQGVRGADEVAAMSEAQLCGLVFAPGLSTVKAATDVSGRGVGLDVVHTAIEGIGGSVDVLSRSGEGTTFTLRVPLSLAIVSSLIVRNDGATFAIPQVNLKEVLRLDRDDESAATDFIGDQSTVLVRGDRLPVVHLGAALDGRECVPPCEPHACADVPPDQGVVTIVVVRVAQLRFGIIVDAAVGSEEVVVKPSQSDLGEHSCSVGSTILRDGSVALILDVNGIYEHAMLRNHGVEAPCANDHESAWSAQRTEVG